MSVRVLAIYPYPFSRERLESIVRRWHGSCDSEESRRGFDAVEAQARETMSALYLIEIEVRAGESGFDLSDITQGLPEDPSAQAPYGEVFLNPDGAAAIDSDAVDWDGSVRIAFWLHHVDLNSPLRTPSGDVPLPWPTPMPARLDAVMEYELP